MSIINFNMKIDSEFKANFEQVCAEYGLTAAQAFKLFANQTVKTGKIPLSFDWSQAFVKDHIVATLKQNEQEQAQGKTSKYTDFDTMMADLAHEQA